MNPLHNKRLPIARAHTEDLRRMSRRTLEALGADVDETLEFERPRTRADCIDGPRPCPFVSCRHHLLLDVLPNGNLKFNFEDMDEMPATCALDVADDGPNTLVRVGRVLNLTRERIRQLEVEIGRRVKEPLRRLKSA